MCDINKFVLLLSNNVKIYFLNFLYNKNFLFKLFIILIKKQKLSLTFNKQIINEKKS